MLLKPSPKSSDDFINQPCIQDFNMYVLERGQTDVEFKDGVLGTDVPYRIPTCYPRVTGVC